MKVSELIEASQVQAEGQDQITKILTNSGKLIPLLNEMMQAAEKLRYVVGEDNNSKRNIERVQKILSGMRGHAKLTIPQAMKIVRLP